MINKTIDWIVKVAGMVICAPVTWLVAESVFADVEAIWLRLELDRNAYIICSTSRICGSAQSSVA